MPQCRECLYDFEEDTVRLPERCAAFSTDMSGLLQAIPWYVARIHKVLQETGAQLEAFDWDLAASDGNYCQRSVETVTRDLQHARAALAEVARSVTGEDLARGHRQ
ncbi:MAG TPA: hypothetical protein VF062_00385 [Candidatus Limnocylindrales bacterium]